MDNDIQEMLPIIYLLFCAGVSAGVLVSSTDPDAEKWAKIGAWQLLGMFAACLFLAPAIFGLYMTAAAGRYAEVHKGPGQAPGATFGKRQNSDQSDETNEPPP